MGESRTVVVTGASRGLGLASAAHLYRSGWTVVAAMRSPEVGMQRLRDLTGADRDDDRLLAVRLDVDDEESVAEAATRIVDAIGPPDAVVHNAGVAGVGAVEEMPIEEVRQIFTTNFFGPVMLTKALLPGMRAAGRGRIVVVSSQGGVRGMPGISAYSAAKGALERWAEALSQEVSPFGVGVTVLITGTFRTDILELTRSWADPEGPYADMHAALLRAGDHVLRIAAPPERFARGLARALDDDKPFARHSIGPDARAVLAGTALMPTRAFQRLTGMALGLPRPGSHRRDPVRLRSVVAARQIEAQG